MRNNTYIHIRRGANSLGKEQKFPCEGIGISLRGNWNFLAREFMRYAAGLRTLGIVLVLLGLGASWNGAWGQSIIATYPDGNENSSKMGRSIEVIYANEGTIDIRFQDEAADCIDGYIRWYVEDANGAESCSGLTLLDGYFQRFQNGYVWVHGDDNNSAPDYVNHVSYNYKGGDVTVVVEGSSIRNTIPQSGNYTSPMVSIQRRYVIKPAKDRAEDLDARKDLLAEIKDENNKAWWESSDAFKELLSVDRNDYYLDNYEIHVPLGKEVTFRLSEKLSNYFVPIQTQSGGGWGGGQTITSYVAATSVRWNVFNANGSRVSNSIYEDINSDVYEAVEDRNKWTTNISSSTDNIWDNAGLNNDAKQTQIFYLVAEVMHNNVSYPASFITLYVEPNAKPLTETELQNPVYKHRTTAYLEDQGYIKIAELNFNDINGDGVEDIATPTAANNFAKDPMANANSYYAYAYPGEFMNRKGTRLSVGRQEYGLYRTLNMENVSRSSVIGGDHKNRTPLEITEGKSGIYNEYFTATKDNANYNRVVVDRSYSNGEGGFFLYLDAADEPGVITKIRMDDRLCKDMRLVVTAWVCDMSASDNESNRVYADVGFTFKGVRSVSEGGTTTEEETILTKYYSGTIGRPKEDSGNGEHALWQQIYFTFNYSGTEEDYDYFILEISNNSRGSNGADYGIDEICVMRSTPRVDVRRMEACDASTLTVNTDYETILANMGWTAGQEVSASASRPAEYAQYGYGLPSDYYGNIYFAFLEGLTEDAEGNISDEDKALETDYLKYSSAENLPKDIVPRTLPSSGNQYRWVRVNRNLTNPSYQSVYSFRTIITTNEGDIPRGTNAQARALEQEKQYNFQAVLDYNVDETKAWAGDDATRKGTIDITADGRITTIDANDGLIASGTLTKENITDSQYDEIYTILIEALYSRLQIPRIRCPWFATVKGEEKLFLYEMNVEHTDLMYAGEQYIEDGKIKTAEGRYHVMVFSGQQISNYPTPTSVPYSEISNPCALVSSFPVQGSLVIRIDTETDPDVLACEGTLRKVSAALKNLDTGEELDTGYSFDWFFGSLEEYNAITFDGNMDLQGAINYVRNQLGDSFTYDDVVDWNASKSGESVIREKLIELMNPENPKIAIDKNDFDWAISSDKIVAMPFVKTDDVDTNLYCTEIQEAPVPLYSIHVPQLHPGYTMTTNPFKGEVALRLGHPNMDTQMELEIPLQSGFKESMANEAQSLRIPETGGVDISWNNIEEGFPPVGTAQQVTIDRDATDAKVVITLNAQAKAKFQEGQRYELRIPFRQYDAYDQPLDNKCDGVIILPIKVVPEYLTWKGSSSDNWRDESKWNQSTEEELYMGSRRADQDANGSDVITNAYSPLYFSKITILGEEGRSELALSVPLTTEENGHTFLNDWVDGDADSIRYEMAVADADGTISPYYINKVDQIYFKPNATLLNQHLLDYQKAWVEFEMANMEKRWMASPLQNVYAGDIYAPTGDTYKGRQETPAFTPIEYKENTGTGVSYSRWAPAFYQKAWNHDVQYLEVKSTPTDDQIATVKAVKNNWSIEYNDVTVEYPIGKGFYLSVEDVPGEGTALVRLPKADKSYTYENAPTPQTKALTETSDRSNAGRLAELDTDSKAYIIDLSKAYNNGDYYLIGNPAMAYLKMEGDDGFLQKNGITKYWTYQEGTFSATVDNMTDEDAFEGGQSNGYIAPMQAFFIEWPDTKGDDETTVSFTPEMFVSKPADSGTESVAYNAFNPTLTLTAERGDQRSVAKLATREDAHDGYEEAEDAIALIDSELDVPVVYTVAGTAAAQVNALQAIRNVGLGVYNEAGGEVTVAIEGMSQLTEPLYLYDAKTRKSMELVGDRYELAVDGESHGRYFLRSGLSTDNDRIHTGDDISIYSLRPGEIVVTTVGTPLRSVRVYGIDGDLVTQQSLANQTAYRLNVPRGAIYVVYAEDADGIIRNVKLRVR